MANKTGKKTIFNGPGVSRPVREGILLGFGNPLLDLVADVPESFFKKYDVKPDNAILAEDKHKPMYAELMDQYDVKFIAGGATQNSIRVAQWLLKSKSATGFIGAVGKDKYAKILKQACEKDGVTAHYFETSEQPTGRCAAVVHDNERSLIADLAAANCYHLDHAQSKDIQAVIRKAEVFYCSGFPMTVPESHKTMVEMCKHVIENDKIFCLNLAAEFIIDFFEDQLNTILPYTDYIFCNESEASMLIKKRKWNCSIEEAALKLAALPKASGTHCRTVIFTQGGDPTIVARNGQLTLYPVPSIAKHRMIDTNGAGDSFVGGFLARLCQGFDIHECVRTGQYASRIVIQQSGCVLPEEPDM